MKYVGSFTSINNKDYKVEFIVNKSGADKEITLSQSPFVATISSEEDKHLYSPLKCGGATVGIITESYIPDLYNGQAKGVKVSLTNETDNKLEWVGYVTPTVYSQGFEYFIEPLEIECVDGIAVLKNVKYQSDVDADGNPIRDFKTFSQLIAFCLNQAECYKNLYITDNVQMTSQTASESVIERFRLSESNLFDKKDDVNEPDEDVAWSCYEVLFEICQFLGYTLITDGEDVIILDYDAIRKGNNSYFKYTLGGNDLKNPTKVTLNYNYFIDGEAYSKGGTNIEMSAVYNKVTVVDEFYEYGSDEDPVEKNITAQTDPRFSEKYIEGIVNGNWYDTCDIIHEVDELTGENMTYEITVHKMHATKWYYTIVKFYTHSKYKFHRYSWGLPRPEIPREYDGVGYMINERGASYMKVCHIELGDDTEWHKSFLYKDRDNLRNYSEDRRREEWVRLLNNKLSNLSYTPCIVMMNGNQGVNGHIQCASYQQTVEFVQAVNDNYKRLNIDRSLPLPHEPYQDYLFWEYDDSNPAIYGSKNAYLLIKGTITTHDEWWNPWAMNNGAQNGDLKYEKKQKDINGMFCWCKMSIGDQWYNGDTWQSEECFFRLYWYAGINEKMGADNFNYSDGVNLFPCIFNQHWVTRYFDKDIPLYRYDVSDFVIGEEGYYVKCPTEGNLNGRLHFEMYCPRDIWNSSKWDKKVDECAGRYWTCVQVLKNFEIVGKINNGGSLGDNSALDSDTVYTNVISNGAVEEMDEINFKITTFDNKNPSYSTVDYIDETGNAQFVDQTFNKANYSKEGSSMRQEEHLVFKLVTQYEDPHLIYNCNIHLDIQPKLYGLYTNKTLDEQTFIIDEIEKDYKFNSASLKLIEKV